MRTYKLYLFRHGLTAANFEGRYIGETDLDLCEQGAAGLLAMKEQYEYPAVGRVYTSPLKRCIETARLLYPEMTPVAVPDLREYSFGPFEGKTAPELRDSLSFQKWLRDSSASAEVGAELPAAFEKRVVRGLDGVIRDMMKDKISEAALVTHAGVISTLLAKCGLPERRPGEWKTESGAGYTLLVNASLWASARLAEVFTPVPFGFGPEEVGLDWSYQGFPDGAAEWEAEPDGE